MHKLVYAVGLMLILAGPVRAGSAINIFRVQVDLPDPGYGYNPLQDIPYQGTVFFSNTSSDDVEHVRVTVTLFDRRQHQYRSSSSYDIGTVHPQQIINQNYRIYAAAENVLVPVVSVTYDIGGVHGESHTLPNTYFY